MADSVLLEEEDDSELRLGYLVLILLIVLVILGNFLVLIAVLVDRKLRSLTTNKFIASLAISDLLVGGVVMPLALYVKINDDKWGLGQKWCQFHLVTGVFSTTASIVHLVAISLDRYFAIMFPTEYQRHAVSTSALPYVIMIWLMSLAVSSTLFLERSLNTHAVCWIEDPQYLVLSSFLSFILPGAVVVFLYVKIFRKLRNHRLSMFGQPAILRRAQGASGGDQNRRSLPRVIIEEVRSRRGSRLSQGGHSHSDSGSPSRRSSGATASQKSDRSPSQPDIHTVVVQPQRWRSPTICAETLEHDRNKAAKKRVSIVPDPPSMDFSSFNQSKAELEVHAKNEENNPTSPLLALSPPPLKISEITEVVVSGCNGLEKALEHKKLTPPSFLTVPLLTENNTTNTPPLSPAPQPNFLMVPDQPMSLTVPRKWDCPSPSGSNPSSGHSSNSSYTSGSASTDADDYRRVSMHSYGSSLTDGTDSTLEMDSRRSSAWSAIKLDGAAQSTPAAPSALGAGKKMSTISRGKLRRIATQVTRAIRRKRRESLAIRRESRATRVVAAILIAFIICWLPYFCISVYRGICLGLNCQLNTHLHLHLFLVSSWLGYAHSCFNPVIYMCLNKNFRRTLKRLICCCAA